MVISIKHSFPLRSLWSSRFRHESVRLSHSMVWVRLEALQINRAIPVTHSDVFRSLSFARLEHLTWAASRTADASLALLRD